MVWFEFYMLRGECGGGFGVDVFRSIKVISDRKLNWIWDMLKFNVVGTLYFTRHHNLNTSNVRVQHIIKRYISRLFQNLNTSNVKVQQNKQI